LHNSSTDIPAEYNYTAFVKNSGAAARRSYSPFVVCTGEDRAVVDPCGEFQD
jgi:hypothetical protein